MRIFFFLISFAHSKIVVSKGSQGEGGERLNRFIIGKEGLGGGKSCAARSKWIEGVLRV